MNTLFPVKEEGPTFGIHTDWAIDVRTKVFRIKMSDFILKYFVPSKGSEKDISQSLKKKSFPFVPFGVLSKNLPKKRFSELFTNQ